MSNTISKNDAKMLATAYNAFTKEVARDDNNGIIVWGNRLLELQKETGMYMQHPDTIQDCIKAAITAEKVES